jgi:hypothetical protein
VCRRRAPVDGFDVSGLVLLLEHERAEDEDRAAGLLLEGAQQPRERFVVLLRHRLHPGRQVNVRDGVVERGDSKGVRRHQDPKLTGM